MEYDGIGVSRHLKVFGISANTIKPKAIEILKELCILINDKSCKFYIDDDTSRMISVKPTANIDEIECLIVIGGDGTILNSSYFAAEKKLPLLGVNLGRLGFLSEIEPSDINAAIDRLLEGKYSLETRSMLKGKVPGSGSRGFDALNDFVMYKTHPSKTVRISVHVDNRIVSDFSCDGIIVSTTTGSSAYSLSSGGPLISPDVEATLITPISPHVLNARPMVFGNTVTIKLVLEDDRFNSACISGDGTIVCTALKTGDEFEICKSEKEVRFIKLSEEHYFELIKRKLST